MKTTLSLLFAGLLCAALCGCESFGFNTEGIDEALTPNVDAETTVRTWQNGANGQPQPIEHQVENPPAFND